MLCIYAPREPCALDPTCPPSPGIWIDPRQGLGALVRNTRASDALGTKHRGESGRYPRRHVHMLVAVYMQGRHPSSKLLEARQLRVGFQNYLRKVRVFFGKMMSTAVGGRSSTSVVVSSR